METDAIMSQTFVCLDPSVIQISYCIGTVLDHQNVVLNTPNSNKWRLYRWRDKRWNVRVPVQWKETTPDETAKAHRCVGYLSRYIGTFLLWSLQKMYYKVIYSCGPTRLRWMQLANTVRMLWWSNHTFSSFSEVPFVASCSSFFAPSNNSERISYTNVMHCGIYT